MIKCCRRIYTKLTRLLKNNLNININSTIEFNDGFFIEGEHSHTHASYYISVEKCNWLNGIDVTSYNVVCIKVITDYEGVSYKVNYSTEVHKNTVQDILTLLGRLMDLAEHLISKGSSFVTSTTHAHTLLYMSSA